jgi:RNA polymerase sigma-70 factor (ECF subfamily)
VSTDAWLIRQIRSGDADAGHRWVREYYPAIYRYLLYLTNNPETAKDLTQETFLQAWRHLDSFDHRAPLRPWLYRIAHREFLQALRRQRRAPAEQQVAFLEEIGQLSGPGPADWTEAVELREIIGKLPMEEAEAVVLHYLEGYSSEEIARIVGRPAGTVRYWLSGARARLLRELGEGDLAYLNGSGAATRHWVWLPLEELYALEARLARRQGLGLKQHRPMGSERASPPPEASAAHAELRNREMGLSRPFGEAGVASGGRAAERLSLGRQDAGP